MGGAMTLPPPARGVSFSDSKYPEKGAANDLEQAAQGCNTQGLPGLQTNTVLRHRLPGNDTRNGVTHPPPW